VDVYQTVLRYDRCGLVTVALAYPFSLCAIDTVHDLRLGLRETLGEGAGQEQVLGRAGAAPF
jgi:hypothetical protein